MHEHLDEVLDSVAFAGSRRAQEFLRLIVGHALGGETALLRERMIGAEMFGRPIGYDTGSDSVVRVKASEVRKKLAQYYREIGGKPIVRIELPSGSYVPLFIFDAKQDEPQTQETIAPKQPSTPVPVAELALTQEPAPSQPLETVETLSKPENTRSRRTRRMFGLGLGLLLLVFGAFGIFAWRGASKPRPQIHSIAILPFENLSGSPDQDYFADGMTDELITDLGQVSALRVISRTSTMSLKGTKKLLPEIARELGVEGIVEGTLQREGDQVRITAKLIDARHDEVLWANTYTRDLTNALALEADLAQTIADKVNANVSPQTHTRMARMRPVNVEAQDLYLRGMQRLNADQCPEAKSYFEKAIEADPKSAQAHAALANCYGRLGENGTMAYDEAFSMQKMEASKAIAFDESLPEGHAELANAAMNLSWDWTTAAREFRRALELNPSSVVAHERYAIYLERVGRFEEAVEEVERGIALDPSSDRSYREAIFTYYFARRYDQALALHNRALASGITRTEDNFFLGDLYAEKGMYAKSISAFKAGGDNAHWLGHLGNAYARAGDTIAARRVIAKLVNHVPRDSVGRYEIALVYAGLGDKQKAFAWLEESYKAHDEGLTNLKLDPCMDPLRSDPRFTDLMRRVGLLS